MLTREIFSTGTFRFSAIASALSGLTTLLLFAFIYVDTAGFETSRLVRLVQNESATLAEAPAADLPRVVQQRYAADLHRATFGAVFDRDGRPLAGDMPGLPPDLRRDGKPHWTEVARRTEAGLAREQALVSARPLPGGGTLLVGRSAAELEILRAQVLRALGLGLIPGMALAMLAGALLGRRTLARISALNASIARIMDGHLEERLPARATSADALDRLAASVNRMLDELERLVREIGGVGDDIAHDLRTPLTRLRARLEGGLRRSPDRAALAAVVEAAIGDLDQTFQTITALLRIGEISSAQRRAGFARVELAPILREVADLYQPIAEQKEIAIVIEAAPALETVGDRDLLFEAVANLVDNAIKFAPANSAVRLALRRGEAGPVLSVTDAGPGIPPEEREAALRRFYQADRSRRGQGHGLGLSIVSAILRLHGFRLAMRDAEPGFSVEIVCAEAPPISGTDSNGS